MNIKILQLDHSNKEAENLLFNRYEDFWHKASRKYPNKDDKLGLYNVVYEIKNYNNPTMDNSLISICDDIFYIFNMMIPEGFNGHSLSVSDIIQIDDRYFYVDSFGFKEV